MLHVQINTSKLFSISPPENYLLRGRGEINNLGRFLFKYLKIRSLQQSYVAEISCTMILSKNYIEQILH